VARIAGVDPAEASGEARAAFEAQTRAWGAPLLNHLVYARRPTIFRGARSMWSGLAASGLIDAKLAALVNRRVAALNGCEF
jgi:alkylhydroperoxidase family enzyme